MNEIKTNSLLDCEDKILVDIFFHNFPDGKINATKVASKYGVSTSVCREALYRLVGKEIVLIKPNIGFFVHKKHSFDNVIDVLNFYLDISSVISRSIFDNMTNEWIAKLYYLLSMWRSLINDCENLIH